MFDRPSRFTASAWMLMFVIISFAGGCGSDGDTSPFDPGIHDQAPPLTPASVGLASRADSKFMLSWVPNVDPDLAGYRVYLYDPSPDRSNAFRCVTGGGLYRATSFTSSGVDGTTYCFRVTAVDTSGNESAMSDPLTFSFSVTGNIEPGTTGDTNQTGRGGLEETGGHDGIPYENGSPETHR